MPLIKYALACDLPDSYRANRVRSVFNTTKLQASTHEVSVDLPIDEQDQGFQPWSIGLIVGPSGSGKTTLAQQAFAGGQVEHSWPHDLPIVDAIGADLPLDEVTGALASVGLGTVPAWLRPHRILSTGEQFRAGLARLLVEPPPDVCWVDEFTSVVDRQVAQIGAAAFAKHWRRGAALGGSRFIALACHRDIIDWLQPDWVLDTETWRFHWRSVRRKPEIAVDVHESDWSAWPYFEPHHYLKLPNIPCSSCYVATVDGEPVAHVAVSTMAGFQSARMARIVVMPEWQGAGIGLRFIEHIAEMWYRGDNRYNRRMTTVIQTSHPGLIAALQAREKWVQTKAVMHGPKRSPKVYVKKSGKRGKVPQGKYGGHLRPQAAFRYVSDRT